jgi:membrane protein DedA with SNARE-associated domain
VLSAAVLVLSAAAGGVVAHAGVGGYVLLYGAVAASWVGVPIVGASFLAAAGVLASEGELDLWLVIGVATIAAWTGGYVGYLIGVRAGSAVSSRPGRWRRQRRRAMTAGERIYRRWGPVAVFVTPTWVSGALGMPRVRFLVWNALAATASTLIATLGAYGIGAAVLGQLSARRGTTALVIAALACVTVIVLIVRHRRTAGGQDTK